MVKKIIDILGGIYFGTVCYVSYLIYLLGALQLFVIFIILSLLLFFIFRKNAKQPFSPLFILSFIFYLSYIFPLIFILNGSEFMMFMKASESLDIISESLVVSFMGVLGVLLASIIYIHKKPSKRFTIVQNVKSLSCKSYVLAIIWVGISGLIRYSFHLGSALEEASISFVGLFQYFLYDGNLVLFSYLLLVAIKRQKRILILLSIFAGLEIVITQAFLGWRSGILPLLISSLFVVGLLYQLNPRKIRISRNLIVALIVLVPFTMQFGNKIRGEYHETEIQYATSVYSFFEKTFMRNQGLSRLMVVIYNNEEHYTPFNDFFVFNLMNNDFTATKYIDKNYYNIPVDQHHSQGGSGVGCLYLDLGMFGVFIGYFLFALVFLYIFNSLSHFKDNDFYIVVYANLAILARYALQENFGIEILKRIFVVILMSLFWLYVLRNKRNVLK